MATKNVLVTGASTGIGEACALHLDRLGWRVFAGVRREEDAEALRRQGSRALTPVHLDITDASAVAEAFGVLDAAVGTDGLHGLVNNAGVARGGPVELLPIDEWRRQFDVNVFGQLAVTQLAIPRLRTAYGRVVFISSISGRLATPLIAPYSASKHAVEAIGFALREELRPWGIAVSVVEPGVVKTPIWQKAEDTAERMTTDLGPDADRLYRDQIERVRKTLNKNRQGGGVDAGRVARAVEHALTSRRWRHRYLVGNDAKIGASLVRFLPDRVLAAVTRVAV